MTVKQRTLLSECGQFLNDFVSNWENMFNLQSSHNNIFVSISTKLSINSWFKHIVSGIVKII